MGFDPVSFLFGVTCGVMAAGVALFALAFVIGKAKRGK